MNNLFRSATVKLTAWYLLLLMILSIAFSLILYNISTSELSRGLRAPGERGEAFNSGLFMEGEVARNLREARYNEGVERLMNNLIVLNAITLVLGGGLSYLLAQRTLVPIKQSMEAQSRFTSDASHELRTPLAIMQSEIEVGLRDKQATKSDYAKLLRSNLDEVHRLEELSARLLMLASESELPRSLVQIDSIAIDAVSRVVTLAQQKDITVLNEIKPITISANHESIADVITILLDNAIKYSPNKTKIRLTSAESGNTVIISVKDEGYGMSAEDIDHIFDRFYRADTSRSRQHTEGHGLGLSIAKNIIEQHSGHIDVESTEGKGSIFTLRLPNS